MIPTLKTSRRDALRLGGLAAGAALFNIVFARVLGREAPGGKVAVGVVGLGGRGRANLDAFLALKDVVVRAVCDVSGVKTADARARADRLSGTRGCDGVSDYRELCARPDIDAVVVAVPDHAHAAVGLAAARGGKDIYGETPFAHTLNEGRALADAVACHGRIFQAGSWQRSQPFFQRAAALVRAGGLGPLAAVEVGLPGGGRGPAPGDLPASVPEGLDWAVWQGGAAPRPYGGVCDFHWRWVSAWGGGTLAEWIGHSGDLALWGAGCGATGPVRVEGTGEYPADGCYDTATAFCFRCLFENGPVLTVSDGGRVGHGLGVRWIGRGGDWLWVTRGAAQASRPELLRAVADVTTDADRRAEASPLAAHVRDFVDAVRTRRAPAAPAEAAHRAASLGHLGELAMRTGRVVRFNPQTEALS